MKTILAAGAALLMLPACSSDDTTQSPVSGGGGGVGSGGTAVTTMMDASSGTMTNDASSAPPADHSVVTTPEASGGDDVKPSTGDAKIVDVSVVDASMDCVKYCACMAMNCATQVFPQGCLLECSKQTNWDLACRQNMCHLVPDQPANDHCTHAFGKGQCTDN